MYRLLLTVCGAVILGLVGGCSRGPSTPVAGKGTAAAGASGTAASAPAGDPGVATAPAGEPARIILRGRYQASNAPCLREGDRVVMLQMDTFEVTQVLAGYLEAQVIDVRPWGRSGVGYPQNMVEGKTYGLVLIPSEDTRRQLRENAKTGGGTIVVDGAELEESGAGE